MLCNINYLHIPLYVPIFIIVIQRTQNIIYFNYISIQYNADLKY